MHRSIKIAVAELKAKGADVIIGITPSGVEEDITLVKKIEPDIVNKFKTESGQASSCINCGYCLPAIEQGGTRCFYGQLT